MAKTHGVWGKLTCVTCGAWVHERTNLTPAEDPALTHAELRALGWRCLASVKTDKVPDTQFLECCHVCPSCEIPQHDLVAAWYSGNPKIRVEQPEQRSS